MRTGFFLVGAFATTAAVVLVQACSADNEPATAQTSSSAEGPTSSSSGGTGGAGGMSAVAADCATLCDHVSMINCTAWENCSTDCTSMFGAPDECADEFAELLSCWVGHVTEFTCTMTQVLPPSDCKMLEDKFYSCVKGTSSVDAGCPGDFCSGDDTLCACKTTCNMVEYKSACSNQGGQWVCSCYAGDMLVGTCSFDAAEKCNNHTGCCEPFLFKG